MFRHQHRAAGGLPGPADASLRAYLRRTVEAVAIPRSYRAERSANAAVRDFLEAEMARLGLRTTVAGRWENVIGCLGEGAPRWIIGAHYDSAPGSPGADDNGSALAAMLGAAGQLAAQGAGGIAFVAFNREEDGLFGSTDFATAIRRGEFPKPAGAHILEMVGYADHTAGSQTKPDGLPMALPDAGDFLGLVANGASARLLRRAEAAANREVPELPTLSLTVRLGIEKAMPHLLRSDHAPFWRLRLPAVMWTDTSEFRNPHYHRDSDLPETLDYAFLERVTRALTAAAADLAAGKNGVPGR
ncbi:MAG: M28 family peptidase [Verrucomicrobiales bacterium]